MPGQGGWFQRISNGEPVNSMVEERRENDRVDGEVPSGAYLAEIDSRPEMMFQMMVRP